MTNSNTLRVKNKVKYKRIETEPGRTTGDVSRDAGILQELQPVATDLNHNSSDQARLSKEIRRKCKSQAILTS